MTFERGSPARARDRKWAAGRGLLAAIGCVWLTLGLGVPPAAALKAITVSPDLDRIEITDQGELIEGRGDSLQVETAAGADGAAGRMSVRASTAGLSPNWVVFALHNPTDRPIERWLTAERYTVIGSGIAWPDLDAKRIEAVTPSLGFLPERMKSDRADVFRITLEPGQTITYAAELASDRFARVFLWKPLEYEIKVRDRQLFNGIMLGITGVLGVFLTAMFAANHKAIFPTAALVTWCVLAYLCVDFGFWHKLFQLRPEDNAIYRAATESAMAASFLLFLHMFLRLGAWNGFVRMLIGVWVVAQLALIAIAVIDARLAATFARASFAAIGVIGGLLMLFLALRGQDRALSLIPTWMLFLVWVFAASLTLTGQLSGDIVVSGLVAGLVLITVLMGFTVTQFAFRSYEPLYGIAPSEQQLRSLAIDSAGAAVWEWHARRQEIKVSPVVEATLGLKPGELSAKVDQFAAHLHPADRERFRVLLWSVQERGGGELRINFRMRHADNTFRWFDLDAAAVPAADRRTLRCVGLMRDVTESKRAQERLMHDAVHDSLTGLPNRELFLDRLGVAVTRARTEPQVRPTVMLIDIDKFKGVNAGLGLIVGDSLLLTVARRLSRHLSPQDTLARLGGDQFAAVLPPAHEPRELARLAEGIRSSLRAPIKIAGRDIVLTGSIGIAIYDGHASADDLLKEAEIAMYRAKRGGADRIEIFRPEFRHEADERITIESDLRAAIETGQLRVLYQPIIYLPTEELAGFEALVRWQHPRLGVINPSDFVPVAEQSDLIVRLGSFVLTRAVQDAAPWHKELPRVDRPLFVSVNVSSRQLFRQDLIQEIRHIVGRAVVPPGALRLEITESLVMENPEQAVEVLEWLRSAGAGLSLDDFGTGYSSLSYLQRFPFDTIKIDRDLVQSATGDPAGTAIVRSIVALAHELGKKVVAEGVEADSDAGFLRSIGCEYAQGFYYGEPMPEREVLQLLRVIRKSERRLQRRGFFRTAPKRKRRAERRPTARPVLPPLAAADATARPLSGATPPGMVPVGAEVARFRPRAASQLPASTVRVRQRGAGPAPRARSGAIADVISTRPPPLPNGAHAPVIMPSPVAPLPLEQNRPNGIGRLAALLKGAQAGREPPNAPSSQKPAPPWAKSLTATLAAASPGGQPDAASPKAPLGSLPPLPLRPAPSLVSISTPKSTAPNLPDLSPLPPAIARSLAKLGNVTMPRTAPPEGSQAANKVEVPTDAADPAGKESDR
jgi:diguanylate cyclase (GGDEF)-like protein/PAS domain S-box-containing protein